LFALKGVGCLALLGQDDVARGEEGGGRVELTLLLAGL
jgi:hypothetical protein